MQTIGNIIRSSKRGGKKCRKSKPIHLRGKGEKLRRESARGGKSKRHINSVQRRQRRRFRLSLDSNHQDGLEGVKFLISAILIITLLSFDCSMIRNDGQSGPKISALDEAQQQQQQIENQTGDAAELSGSPTLPLANKSHESVEELENPELVKNALDYLSYHLMNVLNNNNYSYNEAEGGLTFNNSIQPYITHIDVRNDNQILGYNYDPILNGVDGFDSMKIDSATSASTLLAKNSNDDMDNNPATATTNTSGNLLPFDAAGDSSVGRQNSISLLSLAIPFINQSLTNPSTRPFYGDAFKAFQTVYWPIHCIACLVICTLGIFANLINIVVLTR